MMKSKKSRKLEQSPQPWSAQGISYMNFLIQKRKLEKEKEKEKIEVFTGENSSSFFLPIKYEDYSKVINTGYVIEFSPIKTTIKKQIEMLPDQLHNEIEAALGAFDELFLKRYSNRKISSVTWNKHDCTIVAPVNIKADDVTFIEYQFGDQINKLEMELTAKVIADNVLEAVMKMLLHAKDM